jgi:hypothetical protein
MGHEPFVVIVETASWPGKSAKRVFALDVPAIHVLRQTKTWMPGTWPGMTTPINR